jgi:hypothetical protein
MVPFEEALREEWWWLVPAAAEYPRDDGTLSVPPKECSEFWYELANKGGWSAGSPSIPGAELWRPRGAVLGYGESRCDEAQGRWLLSDTGVE